MHPLNDLAGRSVTAVESLTKHGTSYFRLLFLKLFAEFSTSGLILLVSLFIGSMTVLMLNIAGALWLGEVIGSSYAGFLVISIFDLVLLGIFLLIKRRLIIDPFISKYAFNDEINNSRELEMAIHKLEIVQTYELEKLSLYKHEAKQFLQPEILGMELVRLIQNRTELTATHE